MRSSELLDWRFKAFPPVDGVALEDVRAQGWNLLAGDLMLPALVLKESALEHNLRTMAALCAEAGVSLAPHAKTTLAPALVSRQLAAGAWGITAATAWQARALHALGVERILLANEVVDEASLRWIAAAAGDGLELFVLVDSLDAVALMDGALARAGASRRLAVLVELGVPGGRTGCRSRDEALAVAAAVAEARSLVLAGVEGYEGVIGPDADGTLAAVDAFLAQLRELTAELDRRGAFQEAGEILVTAGGSAFFDRVLAGLAGPWDLSRPVRVVLRSGSYVTHDSGFYARISPLDGRGTGDVRLLPAFEAWGAVLSAPEPGLAIVGFGKRDVPYDLDLPNPVSVRRRSGELEALRDGTVRVEALMDQHAFVRLEGESLAVGDWLGCGISHPCTAFDKWRLIPVVDDRYDVVDALQTLF
jgi:D-serine deaminase-like pyridoxal phosphate-dependent protein